MRRSARLISWTMLVFICMGCTLRSYPTSNPVATETKWPALTLSVSADEYDSLRLDWNALDGVSGYKVERAEADSGSFAVANDHVSTNTYVDSGLAAGVTYTYRVSPYNSNSTGQAAMKSAEVIPAAPTGVAIKKESGTSDKITWSGVLGATGYDVYRAAAYGGDYSKIQTTAALSFVDTGLTSGKIYFYRVQAYVLAGTEKVYSDFASDTSAEWQTIDKYAGETPKQWGETVIGVKTMLDTSDKVVALTLDACGGKGGSGYDKNLIDYLIQNNIPATLFINSRWIDANKQAFMALASNPLFEIENHGTQHTPLSVTGASAYNIRGTKNVEEAIDEVVPNADKIERLTGKRPRFFRSGTAYYDEVAIAALSDLGYEVAGFSVLGDAGATYSKDQIVNAFLSAKPGSIIICHMNHPEKQTCAGLKAAIPLLLNQGYRFVRLNQYKLK